MKWLDIVSLVMYVGSFAIGPRPVFWVLISEIYPQKIRGKAMGLSSLTNRLSNFVVTLTFLTLTGWIGRSGTFFLYATFAVITWLVFFYLIPETKGRSLEDIGKKPR